MTIIDPPTPDETLAFVARRVGLTITALRSGQRKHAAARGLAAWALRETYRGLTVQQIAALLGYRDHTTVLYHITRVAARMSADAAYAAMARALVPQRYTLIMRPVVVE